ncbi:hypothetical protein T261_0807 [Streptomyces lydicus]|nr:hypothetical protein T261_0807 [Streptomyces lydicus]
MDDVLEVIAQQIENRFRMSLPELRQVVQAAPQANQQATEVIRWHGLLTESQGALEKAEDDLVAVLSVEPGELDDHEMEIAQRVNAAVTARDGRAMVVRFLLDPNAPGKQGPGAWRGASPAARRGPALPTTPPTLPSTQAVAVRGATR